MYVCSGRRTLQLPRSLVHLILCTVHIGRSAEPLNLMDRRWVVLRLPTSRHITPEVRIRTKSPSSTLLGPAPTQSRAGWLFGYVGNSHDACSSKELPITSSQAQAGNPEGSPWILQTTTRKAKSICGQGIDLHSKLVLVLVERSPGYFDSWHSPSSSPC
jgi:hypothetical protein